MLRSATINITGTVQGVGFRPFIYRVATSFGLKGYVTNLEDATVEIKVEGDEQHIKDFVELLRKEAPPVCNIEAVEIAWEPFTGRFKRFEIKRSKDEFVTYGSMLPPDISICSNCVSDILTPGRRWYHYPFTVCAHCGPRFTSVYELPYDRIRTNMKDFPLCPKCQEEYADPKDRRFHAQGICCPKCGPQMTLYTPDRQLVSTNDPIYEAAKLISEGFIVAVKGIGGIHLAVKTTEDQPLIKLRKRRRRPTQPFAVMSPDLETVKTYAIVTPAEAALLSSWQKPIVTLKKASNYPLSNLVAPGLDTIGVMLPYTGIHLMLFQYVKEPALVMTSGNKPGLPMAITNDEAFKTLSGIADYLLLHDREIVNRCDDSVIRVLNNNIVTLIRRSRGYVPTSIKIPLLENEKTAFAFGAELRNTGAILYKDRCYLTQHIGDTTNIETLQYLDQALHHMQNLLKITRDPDVIACDLHPRYLTSRFAQEKAKEKNIPLIQVPHHHAHIASLMAENNVPPDQSIIGIALDGIGFGPDGTFWGGEILQATYKTYTRLGSLKPQPMPGGDLCTYYPVRMLIAILSSILTEQELSDITGHVLQGLPRGEKEFHVILQQIKKAKGIMTTSSGRFLDAVSAAMRLCYIRTYEGEPAMKLEAAASMGKPVKLDITPYIYTKNGKFLLDTSKLLYDIIMISRDHNLPDTCATAQHAFAIGIAEIARQVAEKTGITTVGLSGGVAVNQQIMRDIQEYILSHKLNFIYHTKVPPGDGGISLGQSVIAAFHACDL